MNTHSCSVTQAPSAVQEAFLEGIALGCVGEEAARPDVSIVWARVKGYPWWPVRALRAHCILTSRYASVDLLIA